MPIRNFKHMSCRIRDSGFDCSKWKRRSQQVCTRIYTNQPLTDLKRNDFLDERFPHLEQTSFLRVFFLRVNDDITVAAKTHLDGFSAAVSEDHSPMQLGLQLRSYTVGPGDGGVRVRINRVVRSDAKRKRIALCGKRNQSFPAEFHCKDPARHDSDFSNNISLVSYGGFKSQ